MMGYAIYFSSYLFFLTLLFINFKKDKYLKVFSIILIIYLFSVIAGLRYGVAGDFFTYEDIYDRVPVLLTVPFLNIFEVALEEPGFIFLISVFKALGIEYNSFLLLITFFNLSIFFYVVNAFKINVFLSFLLYLGLFYFGINFGLLRQGIASSLVLLSFIFILDKKFIKFVFTILLAASFHVSALFILPFYLLYFKVNFIISFIAFLFAYFFYKMELLTRLIDSIFSEHAKLIAYATSEDYLSTSLPIVGTLLYIVIYFIFLYYKYSNKYLKDSIYFNRLFFLYFMGIIVFISFREITVISSRLSEFLFLSILIIFPMIIQIEKRFILKMLLIFFIVIFSASKYTKTIYGTEMQNHEYKSILFN